MTVGLYEIQKSAANLCNSAYEDLFRPTLGSKITLVQNLAFARLMGLGMAAREIKEVFSRSFVRLCKAALLPLLYDGAVRGSWEAVVNISITTALVALRLLSAAAGVICPELAFGVFHLHKHMLRLGLENRARNTYIRLSAMLAHIGGEGARDRIRRKTVQFAMDSITQRELRGERAFHRMFNQQIWLPALDRAIREEDGGGVHFPQHNVAAFQIPVPAPVPAIVEDFWDPVHVRHPILEAFQRDLVTKVHEEAVSVYREGLYTKDEAEDMLTAYGAIMNRAVFRVINEKLELVRRGNFWKELCFLTLGDGRCLEGSASGGLGEWEQKLIEIKELVGSMSKKDRDRLPFYLCADLDRCRRHAALPDLATMPKVDRCFKLVVEFETKFVAHHLPEDSNALTRAFVLT